jgi:hypothetical protein
MVRPRFLDSVYLAVFLVQQDRQDTNPVAAGPHLHRILDDTSRLLESRLSDFGRPFRKRLEADLTFFFVTFIFIFKQFDM